MGIVELQDSGKILVLKDFRSYKQKMIIQKLCSVFLPSLKVPFCSWY